MVNFLKMFRISLGLLCHHIECQASLATLVATTVLIGLLTVLIPSLFCFLLFVIYIVLGVNNLNKGKRI